ncbi:MULTISPECIES: response regulator transcription factor [Pseudomonas]|jgi:two-component system, NarL family, response regulator EvgA|uniref:LuxR family transcriptional regulator n=1 Tax=Pseudomonas weihenstephanensis TaxID=1608994 RepID=A0A0J6J016_9PSED|nr:MULTISPECIES: response regulator transcription factor [Pseudomonas]KMN12786.1 LuxR family transcriptional regulator [Pseudomonas weihenstephanensis]KMN20045.1 LuxR family transcriptional regulator [Pseudomonas weihenstephanensis]KVV06037.1 Virulence factors putative positive transcription regulator BvgA [Pseudomonas sp. TAD18]KVV07650.1 Virulence factors putative positive transcription regulator BvgA [Pseudomonas sp. TAA207]MBM1189907.1 response regulator transcription factor [Pseudomonas w
MTTVFIVDDHPVIRLAIRMLLEHEGYEIVGETDNGVDAMQMVRECVPDLIILDISIPKLDGLEVLARFNAMNSTLKTLVLTAQSPTLFAMRCMQSGAAGYVCKQEELSELVSAIKAVFSGYNYFPSQALTPERHEDGDCSEIELFKLVNDRELMVLQLFAQGKTNKEIAKGMFLSNKTVSTYKKRLMQKLKANSLVDLIELAKRNSLV